VRGSGSAPEKLVIGGGDPQMHPLTLCSRHRLQCTPLVRTRQVNRTLRRESCFRADLFVGFSVVWVRWRAFPAIDFHDCYLAARALDTPGETVYSLDGDFKKLL